MTTPDPDAYWRRPPEGEQPPGEPRQERPADPEYTGPPPTAPPPAGWRTPVVAQPHTPRQLPPQDHDALDAAEREARAFTYGVGILAGAILLILLFVVCARLVS